MPESVGALIDLECHMATYCGGKLQKISNMKGGGPRLRLRKLVEFDTKEELEKEEGLKLKRKKCGMTLQNQRDIGDMTSDRTLEEYLHEIKRRRSKGIFATVEWSLPHVVSGETRASGKKRKRVRSTSELYARTKVVECTQEENLKVQGEDETLDDWLKRSGGIKRRTTSTDTDSVVKVFERRKVKVESIECGDHGPSVGVEVMEASMKGSNCAKEISSTTIRSKDEKYEMMTHTARKIVSSGPSVQEEMRQLKVSMCGSTLSSHAEPTESDFEFETMESACTESPQAGSAPDLSSQTDMNPKAFARDHCNVSEPDSQTPRKASSLSFCLQTYVKLTGLSQREKEQRPLIALSMAYSETVILSDDSSQLTVLLSDDISQQTAILESDKSQQTTRLRDELIQQVDWDLEVSTLVRGQCGQLEECLEADCQREALQTVIEDSGCSNLSHDTSSETVVLCDEDKDVPLLLEKPSRETDQEEGPDSGKSTDPVAQPSTTYDFSSAQEEGGIAITIFETPDAPLKASGAARPAEEYGDELCSCSLNDCFDLTAAPDMSALPEENRVEKAQRASESEREAGVKIEPDTPDQSELSSAHQPALHSGGVEAVPKEEGSVDDVAGRKKSEQLDMVEISDTLALPPVDTETVSERTGEVEKTVEKEVKEGFSEDCTDGFVGPESSTHGKVASFSQVSSRSALDNCLGTKLEHENRQLWEMRLESVSVDVLKEQIEEAKDVSTMPESVMQELPHADLTSNVTKTSPGILESAVADSRDLWTVNSEDPQTRTAKSHVMEMESPCQLDIVKESLTGSTSPSASGDSHIPTPSEMLNKRIASSVDFCSQRTPKRTALDVFRFAFGETPSRWTHAEQEIKAGCDAVYDGRDNNYSSLLVAPSRSWRSQLLGDISCCAPVDSVTPTELESAEERISALIETLVTPDDLIVDDPLDLAKTTSKRSKQTRILKEAKGSSAIDKMTNKEEILCGFEERTTSVVDFTLCEKYDEAAEGEFALSREDSSSSPRANIKADNIHARDILEGSVPTEEIDVSQDKVGSLESLHLEKSRHFTKSQENSLLEPDFQNCLNAEAIEDVAGANVSVTHAMKEAEVSQERDSGSLGEEGLKPEEIEAQHVCMTNSAKESKDLESEDMPALDNVEDLDEETPISPEIGSLVESFNSTESPAAENSLGAQEDTELAGEDGREDSPPGDVASSDLADMHEYIQDADVEPTSEILACGDAKFEEEERPCSDSFLDRPSKMPCNRKTISPRSQRELLRASCPESERIPPFRIKLLKTFSKISSSGSGKVFDMHPAVNLNVCADTDADCWLDTEHESKIGNDRSQSKKRARKIQSRRALPEDDLNTSLADSFPLTETQTISDCREQQIRQSGSPLPESQPSSLPTLNTPSPSSREATSSTEQIALGSPDHNKQPSLPRKTTIQYSILQNSDVSPSKLASTNGSPPRSLGSGSHSCQGSPNTPTQRPESSRQIKSILKTGVVKSNVEVVPCQGSCKCPSCISTSDHSKTAMEFIASQMTYAERIAGRLLMELANMRTLMEGEKKSGAEGGPSTSPTGSPKQARGALDRATKTENWARAELLKMSRDSKRVCRLIDTGPRRLIFADEAGRRLCHVKYFPVVRASENQ